MMRLPARLTLPCLLALMLGGCAVYAGGGTLVSDGRTTTVNEGSVGVDTARGPNASRSRTVIRHERPWF
jgi:hypothetical protein